MLKIEDSKRTRGVAQHWPDEGRVGWSLKRKLWENQRCINEKNRKIFETFVSVYEVSWLIPRFSLLQYAAMQSNSGQGPNNWGRITVKQLGFRFSWFIRKKGFLVCEFLDFFEKSSIKAELWVTKGTEKTLEGLTTRRELFFPYHRRLCVR